MKASCLFFGAVALVAASPAKNSSHAGNAFMPPTAKKLVDQYASHWQNSNKHVASQNVSVSQSAGTSGPNMGSGYQAKYGPNGGQDAGFDSFMPPDERAAVNQSSSHAQGQPSSAQGKPSAGQGGGDYATKYGDYAGKYAGKYLQGGGKVQGQPSSAQGQQHAAQGQPSAARGQSSAAKGQPPAAQGQPSAAQGGGDYASKYAGDYSSKYGGDYMSKYGQGSSKPKGQQPASQAVAVPGPVQLSPGMFVAGAISCTLVTTMLAFAARVLVLRVGRDEQEDAATNYILHV